MTAYYNEIDPDAAHIMRALIAEGVLAPGDVDTRSIKDVHPNDLRPYTQCHFFAGGGLWSVAARLAGWPDDRELWTGSCPCQPFSIAGKGGVDDARHLWPDFFRLIGARRPAVVVGEQVAGQAGYGWLDGVRADLAGEAYASRGVDIPACAWTPPISDRDSTGARSIWPTQLASQHRPGHLSRAADPRRSNLNDKMIGTSLWVTPSARDWKYSAGMATVRPDGRSRIDQLPRQMAAYCPTPTASLGGARPADQKRGPMPGLAAMAHGGPITNGLPATTAKRGAPNPAFPCWLMGFPAEWVSGAWRAMQSRPRLRPKSSKRS